MSTLREFWSRLDGPIHPDDQPIFDKFRGELSFNREYPPPAFVGDIDRSPIIVLMSNGGYKPGVTEKEFSHPDAVNQYMDYLTGRSFRIPEAISSYYKRTWGAWLDAGLVALVNAVPYRSRGLSRKEELDNRKLASKLPSLNAHRAWLHNEVIPQAREGTRLVLAHRYGWWGIGPKEIDYPCILFSDSSKGEPNRSKPNADKLAFAESWLHGLGFGKNQSEEMFPIPCRVFAERFRRWGIVLPLDDIIERRTGLIEKEGWHIRYRFEYGPPGSIDYFADHRMSGPFHNRILSNGGQMGLDSPTNGLEVTGDETRNRALKSEFYAWNRRIEDKLDDKFAISPS